MNKEEEIEELLSGRRKLERYKLQILSQGCLIDGNYAENCVDLFLWKGYKNVRERLEENLKRLRGF